MAVDMLSRHGLVRNIVVFALPLMAAGIVQQSFNSVDVAVVGAYCGPEAVAAVGSNGPLIGLIVNLFIGIAIGANVVIARYLGQRNADGVRTAVATTALLSIIGGVSLLLIGTLTARPLLHLLHTPDSVIDLASDYLRIYTLGFPAMLAYNFGSAMLRSAGDTRRPFYWLVAGGIINAILDWIFVAIFDMGVEGVATATVIANVVSGGGIVYTLMHRNDTLKLVPRQMRLHRPQLRRILQIGLPAGVQGMVFSLSNLFIQSAINGFGAEAVAGSAAAINYELYCYFVLSAFIQATVAFVSQNYGAGNYAMCRAVYLRCMILGLSVCAALNILVFTFSTQCIHAFTTDTQATAYATERIRTVLVWQWIAGTYEISGGALRALGYSLTPTLITVFGTCVVRVAWVAAAKFTTLSQLLTVYPVTWILTGIGVVSAYLIVAHRQLRVTPPDTHARQN